MHDERTDDRISRVSTIKCGEKHHNAKRERREYAKPKTARLDENNDKLENLFAGERGENVRLIFRQIREMKISPSLTNDELNHGFSMLLQKCSETHYRVNATKFDTWANVETHMLNYTDELNTQMKADGARARKQGENESVGEYLDALKLIFDEIGKALSKSKQIERIYQIMLAKYKSLLHDHT